MSRPRFSVSSRFMLVLVIGFVFQAWISVASLPTLRQSLTRDRVTEIKHHVESAYAIVAFYHDKAQKGLITDRAARTLARDAVRAMRYDGNNYYFIWSQDGTGIVHGAHPEWEGKRFINTPLAKKFPVVSYMVSRLLEAEQGPGHEGTASYKIPKMGQTEPIEKIAYLKLFAPWGWSIGTGAYVDDIDATFRGQVMSLLMLFAGLIGVASIITFFLGRDLARALTRLSARVASVANGEFDGDVPDVNRNDEVGIMARALLILRDNSKDAIALTLDQLTGLPNRKLLRDRLRQAMAAGNRSGEYGGLMFIDLDKFKTLNDTKGHDVGDMLLREVAQRLRSCVREGDTVARLGGDEFVVVTIALGNNKSEAAAIVETIGLKILALLGEPYYFGNITHGGSASIGLTLFQGDASSVDEILKQADLAMYKSKQNGRNGCHFFDPQMEAVMRERTLLEADLLLGIEQKQFELYYQPQIENGTHIRGAEALLRWNHPERGQVQPDSFISFAEQTGLILRLGDWVLETACTQLVTWAKDPVTAHLIVAVNVSSHQFQQPDFVKRVLATLERTGANPCRLDLELTESVLVEDVDAVIAKMLALREHGVSFTLDDFGTGYSSLLYLKRMPLDQLKIDRRFVHDLIDDANDAAIARTIVGLANTLGLGVIAEGVETSEQVEILEDFGCNNYQGYFFSRPIPVQAFEDLVRLWTGKPVAALVG